MSAMIASLEASDWAAWVGAGAAILVASATIAYAILTKRLAQSAKESVEAAKESLEQQVRDLRVSRSLSLIARWNDPTFAKDRRRAAERRRPASPGTVIHIMNFFEELGVGNPP
jgi:hypothetical protein